MLDREPADFFATLDRLKVAFGPHLVATEIPIGAEHGIRGLIDLIDMRAFLYDADGRGKGHGAEIPDDLPSARRSTARSSWTRSPRTPTSSMERYLEGEELCHAEIVSALKRGVTEGHLFPVTCGVATRNLGTDRLLEALIEDLPSPAMGARARCSVPTVSARARARRGRRSRSPTSSRRPPTRSPVA